MHYSK